MAKEVPRLSLLLSCTLKLFCSPILRLCPGLSAAVHSWVDSPGVDQYALTQTPRLESP